MDSTGIQFVNTVHDTKELNILNYRNFYNGGGVAIGDINNDGLADIFLQLTRVAINYILTKAILNLKIFLTKLVSGKKTMEYRCCIG